MARLRLLLCVLILQVFGVPAEKRQLSLRDLLVGGYARDPSRPVGYGLSRRAAQIPQPQRPLGEFGTFNKQEPEQFMDMSAMYFHVGVHETILFKGWHTMNAGELVGSCLGIIVLALLYEGLRLLALKQHQPKDKNNYTLSPVSYISGNQNSSNGIGSSDITLQEQSHSVHSKNNQATKQESDSSSLLGHLLSSCLHMLNVFVSYCLMMVFMTFNVYLCLSVVLGAGLGYAVFFWKRASTAADYAWESHCN